MGIKKLIIFQLLISIGLSLVPFLSYAQSVVGSLPVNKLIREKGGIRVYALNEFGYKRHIPNPEVFNSYGFKWEDIAEVSIAEMDNYSESLLIREANDTKVYFIEDGKKRWVNSVESFDRHNFDWKKVHVINDTDIKAYITGDTVAAESTIRKTTSALPIRAPRKSDVPIIESGKPDLQIKAPKKSDLPDKLIREKGGIRVYVLNEFGYKRHIPNLEVFNSYGFKWEDIVEVSSTEMNNYSESLLIREANDTKVYFIEDGKKRWINSAESFNFHKFDWNEVQVVSDTEAAFFTEEDTITEKFITPVRAPVLKKKTKEELAREEVTAEAPSDAGPIAKIPVRMPNGGGGGTPAPSTDTTPPAAITDLSASSITEGAVTLFWTAPGDDGNTGAAQGYDIRYSATPYPGRGNSGKWFASIATHVDGEPSPALTGTLQSMVVSQLSAETTYYFAMRARDEVRNLSERSNFVIVTTVSSLDQPVPLSTDTIPPAAITDFAASNPTDSSVTLSWTAPEDDGNTGAAQSYDIRYSATPYPGRGNSGKWFASIATHVDGEPSPALTGTLQSMVVSQLSAETTYYFAMRASDEVGNLSERSNFGIVTTVSAPDTTAPSVITDFAASNSTGLSIELTWTAPGDDANSGTATSYDVRYSQSIITDVNWGSATQATGEPAPQAAWSSQSMTISELASGTTYYFAIKTSDEVPNESGISVASNVVRQTTEIPDTTAPPAIDTFSSSSPTTNSITLSWRSPGDDVNTGTATSYDVRYSQSIITDVNWGSATQATGEPAPQVAWSSQSMTISGLASGTTYYFAIKTSDEVPNESGISNVVNRATITCASLASGSQTFSIRSGAGQPQLQRIILDPLDYQTGSSQTIKVKARDTNSNPITSVSVAFTTDSGTTTVSLPHFSGSTTSGYWSASWTPTDTHCATYSVVIIATSASGTSQSTLSPQ